MEDMRSGVLGGAGLPSLSLAARATSRDASTGAFPFFGERFVFIAAFPFGKGAAPPMHQYKTGT
ncbi:hypothetical protein KDAU_37160 [Dictyobacter aurantiacus]|uniref:Uncharacterized protein n=1 Tax=Dictyobacter aurantiacus TaxID=1936993 RepID=A0A401ZHP1_9CHLR|nr:hypothetical protein KDAU_37160 [Dictyobacter aurantiacus]